MKSSVKPKTIDEYISTFPQDTQHVLKKIRNTIAEAAPQAEEVISYSMAAFKQNGILVYFAGWKNHVGFYPVSTAIKEFEKELSKYEYSKGAIKFFFDEPIPYALITRIVKFRVKENNKKAKLKMK